MDQYKGMIKIAYDCCVISLFFSFLFIQNTIDFLLFEIFLGLKGSLWKDSDHQSHNVGRKWSTTGLRKRESKIKKTLFPCYAI